MIIPGILEKDISAIEKKVKQLEDSAKVIQVDISDGKFTPNSTFTYVEKLDSIDTEANFELHLMVKNPLEFLEKKSTKVTRVIIHAESNKALEAINKAKEYNYKVGVCINPETKVEALAPFMNKVDYVQFMTVNPGAQGQEFLPEVMDKIAIFAQTAPDFEIQADGGIDEANMEDLLRLGVKNIVMGSRIFQTPAEDLQELEKETEGIEKGIANKIEPIKNIAFLGGAAWEEGSEIYNQAFETAKILAENGYLIVNGGGPGVMEAATKGGHAGGSDKVLAVTYHPNKPKKNYEGTNESNDFDEEVVTLDYFDRTKVMLQNSDVHIVFKGGTGTISEFGMTWASSRIHEGHHKPIILYGDFWNNIIESFKENMLMRPGEAELLKIVNSPEEVLDYINSLQE